MSVLTLVRHGQASFFADDYDKLSEVGQTQSRLLGKFWAQRKMTFTEVYTGPRSRQKQSAELAGAECLAAGVDWPAPVILDDIDEYDLDGFVRKLAPRLFQESGDFASLVKAYKSAQDQDEMFRKFQRMFETLVRHWQSLDTIDDGVESWASFQQRVARVIQYVQEQPGRGRRVVMFTSGGFIGGAIQQALGLTNEKSLEMNWRIRNGSLTEFVFTRDRFSLDVFNAVPHLEDPALWTYR